MVERIDLARNPILFAGGKSNGVKDGQKYPLLGHRKFLSLEGKPEGHNLNNHRRGNLKVVCVK
jgi:hypothetical protein